MITIVIDWNQPCYHDHRGFFMCYDNCNNVIIELEKDNITFDSKLHVFNVKGGSGVTRVVTLFPNATCSCPSMGDCYHVLAAKCL